MSKMQEPKYKTNVTFDREQILRRVDAQKYHFLLARRRKDSKSHYEVLIREFLEEGCVFAATYFLDLIKQENILMDEQAITKRVRDDPEFLFEIVENIKNAEKAAELQTTTGHVKQLNLLYRTALTIERKGHHFEWLMLGYFDLVNSILSRLNHDEVAYNEIRVRFFYKYGSYLLKRGFNYDLALEMLNDAMNICLGETWTPDTEPEKYKYKLLQEAVVRKLGKGLLTYAKLHLDTDPEKSIKLASDAILVLAKIGFEKHKSLICNANIEYINFMIEGQKYKLALQQVKKLQRLLTNEDRFYELKCTVLYLKGVCYYNLNLFEKALIKLRQAYTISCKYKVKNLEGVILLQIGKVHSMFAENQDRANKTIKAAREIFVRDQDYVNRKKANYILANWRAHQMWADLLHLIRSKEYFRLCQLRKWKNQCRVFWTEVSQTSKFVHTDDELLSTSSNSDIQDSVITDMWLKERNEILRQEDITAKAMCNAGYFTSRHQLNRSVTHSRYLKSHLTLGNINFIYVTDDLKEHTRRCIKLKNTRMHLVRLGRLYPKHK